MVNNNLFLINILACLFVLSACTWVKLTPEGENVRVLTAQEAENCKKVARTTHSLKADVMGIDRKKEKVKTELETLARNAAPEYEANAVMPATEIEDGKQSFDVFKCE